MKRYLEDYKLLLVGDFPASFSNLLNELNIHYSFVKENRFEVLQAISKYNILLVKGFKVDREIISSATNLSAIIRMGVGVDNIDLEFARKNGIVVMNTPKAYMISTAELTIGLILLGIRRLYDAIFSLKKGSWERDKFLGEVLFDKVVGIIGFGRIGREVAKRLKPFGVEIIAYDPYVPREIFEKYGVFYETSLSLLLKKSDIITLHIPLTEETRKMISYKEIEMMKDGVYVINTSRGDVVDEEAMRKALLSNKVRAFLVDVFSTEPPHFSWLKEDNVYPTPHIGSRTKYAMDFILMETVNTISDFIKNGITRSVVNFPYIRLWDYEGFDFFIKRILSIRMLGRFIKVLYGIKVIKSVRLVYPDVSADRLISPYLLIAFLFSEVFSCSYISVFEYIERLGIKVEFIKAQNTIDKYAFFMSFENGTRLIFDAFFYENGMVEIAFPKGRVRIDERTKIFLYSKKDFSSLESEYFYAFNFGENKVVILN